MRLNYSFFPLLFLTTLLLAFLTGCSPSASEEQEELEVAAAEEEQQEEAPAEHYEYYLDNEQVEEGTFSVDDEELEIVVTGEPDPTTPGGGLIKIWAFSSEDLYIAWGEYYGMPVACQLEVEKHLRDYAEYSGAIAHYEETGEILPEYEEYATEYYASMNCSIQEGAQRGVGFIYQDYFGGPAALMPSFLPAMWPGWNNRVSRYQTLGIYNCFIVYDRSFFRRRLATLWNWGWTNWRFWFGLAPIDNRMSSGMLF